MSLSSSTPGMGQTFEVGVYYRNLKKEDVAPHYKNLDVGYRLKLGAITKWDWEQLSVNEQACCNCCPKRSIELVPAGQYLHVWEIDLSRLNVFLKSVDKLVALYDPVIEPPGNKCHYILVPLNGQLSVNQVRYIFEKLEEKIPPVGAAHPKKAPKVRTDEMDDALGEYRGLVVLHLDCGE